MKCTQFHSSLTALERRYTETRLKSLSKITKWLKSCSPYRMRTTRFQIVKPAHQLYTSLTASAFHVKAESYPQATAKVVFCYAIMNE